MASDAHDPQPSSAEGNSGDAHLAKKQAALRAWRRTNLLAGLVVFLLVGVSLLVALRGRQNPGSTRDRSPSLTQTIERLRSSDLLATEQEALERRQARLAAAQRELLRMETLVLLRKTEPLGRRYEETLEDWRTRLSDVAASEAGRRLLAVPDAWSQAVALKRITDTAPPIAWREEFERLAERISAGSIDTLTLAQRDDIPELQQRLRSATNTLQSYRSQLDELVASVAGANPTDDVVSDAFAWHEARVADQRRERAAQAARDEEQKIDAEVRELGEQRAMLLATAKRLTEDLAAAQRGEKPTGVSRPATVTAGYQDRLPEMQRLLRPFLAPGYAQPLGSEGLVMETVKRPMSYGAIRSAGALEDTNAGLAMLFRLGGWKGGTQRNDRPLGDFPRMNSDAELAKPAVRASVHRAQQLLRDYGPQLVLDRLLAE